MKLPWPQTLTTRRLVLRPLVPADHAAWIEGFTTRNAPRYKQDGGPHDPRTTPLRWFRGLCALHRRLWTSDDVYHLGVFQRSDGRHVGHIDVSVLERRPTQRGELGYQIHNTHQRHGYATEAVTAALRFAFGTLKLHRIEAVIDVDNTPSLRLAAHVGMQREGVRPSFYFQHGRWEDQVIFVAIRGRWRARPRTPRTASQRGRSMEQRSR
jgi:RimJ/RimL family protein N-acetyltransferase